jgi:hypothetical protein
LEVHVVPPADQPVFFVLICLLVRSWFHTNITNIGRNRQHTTFQWHVGSILFIWCGFGVQMAGQTLGLLAMSTDTQTLSLFRPRACPRGSHDLCATHNHNGNLACLHGLPMGSQSRNLLHRNSVARERVCMLFQKRMEKKPEAIKFVERFILDNVSVFR